MNGRGTQMDNSIVMGNAVNDLRQGSSRGWFIGHFIDPACDLRCTQDVEVKWGEHQSGEKRPTPIANEKATTLTLLLEGAFVVEFPGLNTSAYLKRTGDYVIFAPGVVHSWETIEDSVILTIRWPSIPDDQK